MLAKHIIKLISSPPFQTYMRTVGFIISYWHAKDAIRRRADQDIGTVFV